MSLKQSLHRCLMGAILIGAVIEEPATCLSPGDENKKNDFVNAYCLRMLKRATRLAQRAALAQR